jgi:flagellin
MRIATNISAMTTNNALQKAENRLSKSIARLSSGYKINDSSDDAAGYAISQKMRLQLKGLEQADNNASDGISVLYTAEGAMEEIQNMLARMKELTVQAANDTNSDEERLAVQEEIDSLNSEIDRISNNTEFNSRTLVNGNLSRRVYSNYEGVNQLETSDNIVAGNYGITITQDPRQAVAMEGNISMTSTQTVTEAQAGTISINGYAVEVAEGDSLDSIVSKVIDAADKTGGKAFVVAAGATNDTKTNGTEYAGYTPATTYDGGSLVIMTKQYGSSQSLTITCDNADLAAMLGIPSAATDEGLYAEGTDVQADFATGADGKRIGFADSAAITTDGSKITVKDINNKTFKMDVPGNIAGTVYNDATKEVVNGQNTGKSTAGASSPADVIQEVTDVGTMSVHVGANENQVIVVDIPEISSYTLGTENINVMTHVTAEQAISIVDEAVQYANSVRSKLGAYENRFEHTSNNIATSTENLTSSISTMTDTDMAEEMTEYTSLNVLTQAATSILAQANERPSTVLQILQ